MPRRLRFIVLAVSALGAAAVGFLYLSQLARSEGVPVPPLDDTYIHLQYAKLLAKGFYFHYVPGEGYTTGATSPAYVALLAVFFRLGLSDAAVTWTAYLLGVLALGVGAYGAALAVWRATEDTLATLVTPILVFACGSLAGNSLSGMETGVYSAILVVALAATFADGKPTWRLYALYTLLPLIRPDGAIFVAIFAAATIWRTRGERGLVGGAWRMALVFVPFVIYLVGNFAFTGEMATAGMRLKSFSSDIYTDKLHAAWQIIEQSRLRLSSVFADKLTPPLLPIFVAPVALLGLVLPGGKRFARAVLALAIVLGYLALNNTRGNLHGWQRYFVPLYPLVVVGAAMGVSAVARWLPSRVRPWIAAAAGLALAVGMGVSHAAWRGDFGAESAEIAHKQVAIALRIRELPAGARVATMDVGAVAFIGGHPTFDVIGLTTNGIYPYALLEVPGRVESLGSLAADNRPEWAALYGSSLPREAIGHQVADGRGFLLYQINWAPFDAANHPAVAGTTVDRVDVADARSEAAHHYMFEPRYLPVAVRAEMHTGKVAGEVAIDSARPVTHEAFTLHATAGKDAILVLRTVGRHAPTLTWNGQPMTLVAGAAEAGFVEMTVTIPAAEVAADNHIVVDAPKGDRYPSYHWFLVQT